MAIANSGACVPRPCFRTGREYPTRNGSRVVLVSEGFLREGVPPESLRLSFRVVSGGHGVISRDGFRPGESYVADGTGTRTYCGSDEGIIHGMDVIDPDFETLAQDADTRIDRQVSELWESFCATPVTHPDEVAEFRHLIHGIQGLMALRRLRRQHPEEYPTYMVGRK